MPEHVWMRALLATLVLSGCDRADPRPAEAPRVESPAAESWYRAVEARDLTGDGVPETLAVAAEGTHLDSLRITFTISSGGRVLYEESWWSAWYFVYDAPLDSIPEARKRARILGHLEEFFEPGAFGALAGPPPGAPGVSATAPGDEPLDHISAQLRAPALRDSLARAGVDSATAALRAEQEAYAGGAWHSDARATWREMYERAPTTFTFFSGGEHTRTIAWSGRHWRFFTVESCC
jgi:hypothetical protein